MFQLLASIAGQGDAGVLEGRCPSDFRQRAEDDLWGATLLRDSRTECWRMVESHLSEKPTIQGCARASRYPSCSSRRMDLSFTHSASRSMGEGDRILKGKLDVLLVNGGI